MNEKPDSELSQAAAPTLERVRAQRVEAVPRIATMLAYIEHHLFDPELSVSRMKRDCHLRDNSIAIHFHGTLGLAPAAYISRCRTEVAQRLLSATALPIWRISEQLGYSSIQVFSRAFFRQAGTRPSAYRRKHPILQKSFEIEIPAPEPTPEATLQKALRGDLPDEEAGALIRRLLDLYPPRAVARAKARPTAGSFT